MHPRLALLAPASMSRAQPAAAAAGAGLCAPSATLGNAAGASAGCASSSSLNIPSALVRVLFTLPLLQGDHSCRPLLAVVMPRQRSVRSRPFNHGAAEPGAYMQHMAQVADAVAATVENPSKGLQTAAPWISASLPPPAAAPRCALQPMPQPGGADLAIGACLLDHTITPQCRRSPVSPSAAVRQWSFSVPSRCVLPCAPKSLNCLHTSPSAHRVTCASTAPGGGGGSVSGLAPIARTPAPLAGPLWHADMHPRAAAGPAAGCRRPGCRHTNGEPVGPGF